MDWKLRSEIAQVFASESVRYHYEVMNEFWLTGVKLAEQIQFFSPSWLKRYGYLLPRERMVMVDEDGVEHEDACVNLVEVCSLVCVPAHAIFRGHLSKATNFIFALGVNWE